LAKRKGLRYSYRFTIVPETIGSIAYLSHNEALIPQLCGGLFLEMLGRNHPHALQLSFDGASEVDRCFTLAMRESDPYSWTGAFRTLVGNDERQFNAPGVRVPMLSLSRVLRTDDENHYFDEYHSSDDTPDRVPPGSLEASRDLVLRMIDTLEANVVPVNRFKGEVFCSRYGINIDPYVNPEGARALFDIMFLIDGTRSVADIAEECRIPFSSAKATLDELRRHGLVEYPL
jgi:aminopeptidase-like protein